MNKEELIFLKKELKIAEPNMDDRYQAEIDLGQFVGSEKTESLSEKEIIEKSNASEFLNDMNDTLFGTVYKAAKLGVDIASLKVIIKHAFFINETYLRLKEKFGEGGPVYPLSLNDIVNNYLAIIASIKVDAYSGYESDIDLLKTTSKLYIVNFDVLVKKLIMQGYLENKFSFEEFFKQRENLNFQIDFEPSKKRTRNIN